jgi:hypothetical protein
MGRFKRAYRAKRGSIHSYVHLERKRRAMEMRMEALDEGFKGDSFHGGL